MTLDKRLNAYRPDIAAIELQDEVESENFIEGVIKQVSVGVAALRTGPSAHTEAATQLLFGEEFRAYAEEGEWVWGQSIRDLYVGYVHASVFSERVFQPTHQVSHLGAFLFTEPNFKLSPVEIVTMNAFVSVVMEDGKFALLQNGLWVYKECLTALDQFEPDYVVTAEKFLDVPYLWGGRSFLGVDCSGLIQLALQRANIPCLRDSDMQRDMLGQEIDLKGPYLRGDFVFFPGHVGIMMDSETIIHANASAMRTSVDPVSIVAARSKQNDGQGILKVRRL